MFSRAVEINSREQKIEYHGRRFRVSNAEAIVIALRAYIRTDFCMGEAFVRPFCPRDDKVYANAFSYPIFVLRDTTIALKLNQKY